MKNKIISFLPLFVFMVVGITIASCQQKSGTANNTTADNGGEVAVEKFESLLQATPNAYVIDVRTPGEYAEGYLKNAVNIDVNSSSFETEIQKLDTAKTVFVYCLAGSRSASAARYMRQLGFKTVYEMQGGILKWKKAGKPLQNSGSSSNTKGMSVDEFTKQITNDNYVLVDFNAKWCKPCIAMAPTLEKLAVDKKDKLTLLKIDADQNETLLKHKGIDGIPVLELYYKGQLVWQHNGFIDEVTLLRETKL